MSGAIILSDGDRDLELPGLPSLPNGCGIWLSGDPVLPLLARENTYADSPDSDGRRRVRTRNQNSEQGLISLAIGATVESDFWDFVDDLEEMVESVHRNRGTLRYEPPADFAPVTFDIESIVISGLPQRGTMMAHLVCEGEVAFEVRPGARQDPVVIITGESLGGPIDSVELPNIPGHLPAWVEATLTDASAQNRGHIEVGIQEDYDPSDPEPVRLSLASGLTVSGYAGASTTRAGSVATNVARATLTSSPVVVCATSALKHKGRWKVRPRIYPSADTVRVRLAWKVGDGPITRERWMNVPGGADFFDLELQVINIEELETGHSWTGYIEAYATSGTPTVDVDEWYLLPADNYAKVRTPQASALSPIVSAYDQFLQSAGALTGKTSGSGHVWTAGFLNATMDTDDFQVDAVNDWAERASVSDTNPRVLHLPTSLGAEVVGVDISLDTLASARQGLEFRASDGTHYGHAYLIPSLPDYVLWVEIVSGGSGQQWFALVPGLAPGAFTSLDVAIYADGTGAAWVYTAGAERGAPALPFYNALLATGGALANGYGGLYDFNNSATACERRYRNFRFGPAESPNAALYANRSAHLEHDIYLRQNAAGTSEGRLPIEGRYPTVRPATRAGRRSRLVCKVRRNDSESGLPDRGTSDSCLLDLNCEPRVVLLCPPATIPGVFPTYTLSSVTTDRALNANSTTLDELADVLGTLIGDLPLPLPVFTFSNVTTDRSFDCNATTLDELADVLGTLYNDLVTPGPAPPYTITNLTTRRIMNANSINVNDYADILGTVITDLDTSGDL